MIGYTMGMTEVDVGKKISNLRTYYIREMVKRDKAIMQGQITPETYVPRWPYYDALDVFLGDVVRKKRNEALVASGMAPELHFMYVEEHHSDSDNDHDDLAKLDDNDLSRDSAGSSGGGTATITSTATTTGGDGGFLGHNPVAIGGAGGGALPGGGIPNPGSAVHDLGSGGGHGFAGGASATSVPPGMVLVEEDDDWLFGRYLVRELKKVMSFKDKQLAKMKMTQIVTYAQLGMNEPTSSDADVTNS
nr:hypothetical protein BaRGS_005472 [Batillaria attramentaria]